MHAYDKTYLQDAMGCMGAMTDFAAGTLGMDLHLFYDMFLSSGVAEEIERGNPRFLAGMSGREMAAKVLAKSGMQSPTDEQFRTLVNFGAEYWCGWILCYLQWYTAYSFRFINGHGMDIETVLALFPTLHEADPQKFVDTAIARIKENTASAPSKLKAMRKAAGLTQQQLAELSDTSLRAIQSYEQKYLDISKAEAGTVLNIAKALGCSVQSLIEQ